jgi:hypothetical protein
MLTPNSDSELKDKKIHPLEIVDASGDHKYFTQIPNIVVDSDPGILSLYTRMKRYAGVGGRCFATHETLSKGLAISKVTLAKELKELINKGWISLEGTIPGKTRPVNSYKIEDIWLENAEYYDSKSDKKISSLQNLSPETQKDKFPTELKISFPESHIERVINTKKDIIHPDDKRLAELLFSLIKIKHPNWNDIPNWFKWSDEIRKLREIDKREVSQIEDVIRWCQNDDFWSDNILSTAKLRKQFNTLVVKMDSKSKIFIPKEDNPLVKRFLLWAERNNCTDENKSKGIFISWMNRYGENTMSSMIDEFGRESDGYYKFLSAMKKMGEGIRT